MKFGGIAALAALCGFVALAITMSKSGDAAFPGVNGRIAYSYGDGYQGSIWAANGDGSSPGQLTTGSNDWGPAYSANGSRIAFERANGVAVMNADGSSVTQLLNGSSSNSSKTEWEENYETPGGETLPFVKIETFTGNWHYFGSPAFTPDGSQLAVVKGVEDTVYTTICAVEEEEGQLCLDYEDPDSYFHYDYDCVDCSSQIITVSSTSGAQVGEVTAPSSETYYGGPVFSASGQLAYSRSSQSQPGTIFVVNSPGSAPIQVTSGTTGDYSPDFSPDGSRIVFSHGSREIGLVSAGGGPVTILPVPAPPGTSSYVNSPVFSPDGTRIAFGRTIHPAGGKSEQGIYTMGIDGSGLTKILNGSSPDWQAVAPPPPPPVPAKGKAAKGKVKLNKKGQAVVGTITCGSSPCTLKVLSVLLKIHQLKPQAHKAHGKASTISKKAKAQVKVYKVKAAVPKKLAPGKKGKVTVTVKGPARAALEKAGKGALTVKVKLTEALGKKVLVFNSKLTPPPPAHKHKKHRK